MITFSSREYLRKQALLYIVGSIMNYSRLLWLQLSKLKIKLGDATLMIVLKVQASSIKQEKSGIKVEKKKIIFIYRQYFFTQKILKNLQKYTKTSNYIQQGHMTYRIH